MTLRQKESKWRMALCLFAAYALSACSDDNDVPKIDDEEPPVTEISVPTPNPYLAAQHHPLQLGANRRFPLCGKKRHLPYKSG